MLVSPRCYSKGMKYLLDTPESFPLPLTGKGGVPTQAASVFLSQNPAPPLRKNGEGHACRCACCVRLLARAAIFLQRQTLFFLPSRGPGTFFFFFVVFVFVFFFRVACKCFLRTACWSFYVCGLSGVHVREWGSRQARSRRCEKSFGANARGGIGQPARHQGGIARESNETN